MQNQPLADPEVKKKRQPKPIERLPDAPFKGSAHVTKLHGRVICSGDYSHCNPEDVAGNIRFLAKYLEEHAKLTRASCDYTGHMYVSNEHLTYEQMAAQNYGNENFDISLLDAMTEAYKVKDEETDGRDILTAGI